MKGISRLALGGYAVALLSGALHMGAAPLTSDAVSARVSETYGKLPLSFEANYGQVDASVAFLSRGSGYTLFLTPTEAVVNMSRQGQETTVGLRLVGGNGHPSMIGVGRLATTSNYFIGKNPRYWHTGVAHYEQVHVKSVYPGVDMVYRGNRRQLEYDFVVAPGADPAQIRLTFRGVVSTTIGAQGELILRTAAGEKLVQPTPMVYQDEGERRELVEAKYVFTESGQSRQSAYDEVGIEVGAYDRSRPLIIDPVLVYSTFLGGNDWDMANGIAVDSTGSAYVTGRTRSTTFPGVSRGSLQAVHGNDAGNSDAFVTKINAAGTEIVYSTFLGGNSYDSAGAIAVDSVGNAYLAGTTFSASFPGIGGPSIKPILEGGSDAFVVKISATGAAIVYSTFLGGSGFESGSSIAVDDAGASYVAGNTGSLNFPVVSGRSIQPGFGGGPNDAFVAKLNAAGTAIVYSTFLGGIGDDQGLGPDIAVDGTGAAYVAGNTSSSNFAGTSESHIQSTFGGGRADTFVTKISPAGTAIIYSTFLGGSGDEFGKVGIAVDGADNVYIAGHTTSTIFPGVNEASLQPVHGGSNEAYVTKINPAGTSIVYSSFLGGAYVDSAADIAVDTIGNAYVTGNTSSTPFPGVNSRSIQPAFAGYLDAFITKINASGTAIVYSTYLGGRGEDGASSIAVDVEGNAYVTGHTESGDYLGINANSIQPSYGGGISDAFVTKINPSACGGIDHLCLNDARFEVTATFNSLSISGVAHAVQLTPDTGYFWFFSPSNVEAVVKVLNGCGLSGHYWVFAGGLTNVNMVITVTDTETGLTKSYTNPQNTKFQPIQDTKAFATCSSLPATSTHYDEDVVTLEANSMRGSITQNTVPFSVRTSPNTSGCVASHATLCLNGGRFQVTAMFDTGGELSGPANVVQLTPDTGYFWFFDRANVEAVVKVLDGCDAGGHYWVFAGGLTDVKMVMTVIDTLTGVVKTYTNPLHTKFQPIQDTSAFATCP